MLFWCPRRASHTTNKRDKVIVKFNEVLSNLDILIINTSLSRTGLEPPCIRRERSLKRMIASEILRFKVGHPFNHFVWTVKLIIRPKNEMNKIPKDSRIDALLGANVQLLFLNSNSNSRQLASENDEARGVKLARLPPPAPAQEPLAPAGPS